MTQADKIRLHAARYIDSARQASRDMVTIRAGDVGWDLGLYKRIPAVCSALGSRMFLEQEGLRLLERKGPRQSTTTEFRYASLDTATECSAKDRDTSSLQRADEVVRHFGIIIEGKHQVLRGHGMGDRGSNGGSTSHTLPQPTSPDTRMLVLLSRSFVWVARIQPKTRKDGTLWTCMPQKRYANAAQKPLNPHGAGPFCRFDVDDLPDASGVYAVTLNGRLVYVGIAKNLKQRWGSQGFGRISPGNCYVRGQSTNCKVNHAILQAVQQEQIVDLWIYEMEGPRALEKHIIQDLDPLWNNRG